MGQVKTSALDSNFSSDVMLLGQRVTTVGGW
jgi:hypothetical protein